jgi:hypothetical protein
LTVKLLTPSTSQIIQSQSVPDFLNFLPRRVINETVLN